MSRTSSRTSNKTSTDINKELIKETVFPFNINPLDYNSNSDIIRDIKKLVEGNSSIKVCIIEDEQVRYSGNFFQIYWDGMYNLRDLRAHGLSMLNYIYRNIKFGSNWIVLNQTSISKELMVKQQRVYDGISQLINNGFIVKGVNCPNNVYIINHNYIFKGDRNKFINDYIKLYYKE